MPELAELRLTADYINACSQGDGPRIHYISIEKNPAHKGTHCITPENPGEYFSLSAKSRGKELLIYIHKDNNITPIRMTMGMSGHFELTNTGQESKHAHLKFYRKDGTTLSFVDVRRFGKWKASETWSINRGPDPVFDHTEFIDNIYKNINKAPFNKPINEILLNQKFFNGIGNYIRSEVLGRIPDLNPFTDARTAIHEYPKLLDLCQEFPYKAYLLGGGKIGALGNPFRQDDQDLKKFIRFYRNTNKCIPVKNKSGRIFWCDKKWVDYILN